jgi:hypothetical protein
MTAFEALNHDETFRYMLLSRMKMDCEFYLNYGNRRVEILWAGNVAEHIKAMVMLHSSFPENGKPEWLTLEQIKAYENRMEDTMENNKISSEPIHVVLTCYNGYTVFRTSDKRSGSEPLGLDDMIAKMKEMFPGCTMEVLA